MGENYHILSARLSNTNTSVSFTPTSPDNWVLQALTVNVSPTNQGSASWEVMVGDARLSLIHI